MDRKAAKDLKLAKKTFNVITSALMDQLLVLFTNDATLKVLKVELAKFAADLGSNHVPAVKYFTTMNLATKIKSKIDDKDDAIVVGELIVRKDPVIFTKDVGVVIPELEALGMQDKWPKLNTANQEMVWDYLIRMAKTSAQVVIGMQMVDGRIPAIIKDLADKGVRARPGMSEQELAHFAEQVKETCLAHKD